jgi:hypothetical protein
MSLPSLPIAGPSPSSPVPLLPGQTAPGPTGPGKAGAGRGAPVVAPAAEPPPVAAAAVAASALAPLAGALPARPAIQSGTPVTAPAARVEFGRPTDDAERAPAIETKRRWSLAEVLGAIGKAPGPEAILAMADRPGPVEPGSLLEAVKAMRASIPSGD